jgi:glycosyltransferase involved in cell wall biosynthesis
MTTRVRVTIIQSAVFEYRREFYELLHARLAAQGVQLTLIHSNELSKTIGNNEVDLPWAVRVPARWFRIGGRYLLWQPAHKLLADSDLVIVEQASKHLLNYVLAGEQMLGRRRLALWGHGKDFATTRASTLGELVKGALSRRVHWWFAYTELSAQIVASTGFPYDRITVVRNTLDTRATAAVVDGLDREATERIRHELGVGGHHVGLFLGGLVPSKRLEFLREAADTVAENLTGFALLVAGAGEGPEARAMEDFARVRPWVHILGGRYGREKAELLAIADVIMVPAWAGLVVVDSFAAGVPLVASSSAAHPPEVSYIKHEVNGLLVEDDGSPQEYGRTVAELLGDPLRLATLAENCRKEREYYSVEAMVDRFAVGISKALEA